MNMSFVTMNFSVFVAMSYAVVMFLIAVLIMARRTSDEYRVSRSNIIYASPAALYQQVNTLRNWQSWSPWAKIDPNAKIIFEGPESGVGAVMHWEGNKKIGKGSLTITEVRPDAYIQFRLDMQKPISSTSTVEFRFDNNGSNQLVTWAMYGKKDYTAKIMSVAFNCDKHLGEQLEKGLSNLKSLVELQK